MFSSGFVRILNAIGELPPTFWGIIVLFISMRIATHNNADIGYYFAGVGSTLLGINKIQNTKTTTTTPTDSVQVETNASNSTN